jgi:hypothetical protein
MLGFLGLSMAGLSLSDLSAWPLGVRSAGELKMGSDERGSARPHRDTDVGEGRLGAPDPLVRTALPRRRYTHDHSD